MATELVHVGFGNIVAMNRVVAIVSPNSAPIKRLIKESEGRENGKDKGKVIDMTNGRRTKAVIVSDSGHLLLVAISAETLAGRLHASYMGTPAMVDGKNE